MPDTRPHRSTSPTTDRSARLDRYVTTVVAAAAGAATAAGSAEAAVIRSSDQAGWTAQTLSRTGVNIGNESVTNFQDAKLDKAFRASVGVNLWQATGFGGEWIRGGVFYNRNVGGYAGAFFNGRLASGAVVGSSRAFANMQIAGGSFEKSGDPWVPNRFVPATIATLGTGPWSLGIVNSADSVRGYLGFRFSDGKSDFYGYFDVELARNGRSKSTSTFSMIIHGWAYDDSGAPITISAPVAIPGGAGLAALAAGAVGLRGRRRSRVA